MFLLGYDDEEVFDPCASDGFDLSDRFARLLAQRENSNENARLLLTAQLAMAGSSKPGRMRCSGLSRPPGSCDIDDFSNFFPRHSEDRHAGHVNLLTRYPAV